MNRSILVLRIPHSGTPRDFGEKIITTPGDFGEKNFPTPGDFGKKIAKKLKRYKFVVKYNISCWELFVPRYSM